MGIRAGKHARTKSFKKLLSATLLSALIGAFFVQIPITASASSVLFSNLEHSAGGWSNQITRANIPVGLKMSTPSDYSFTEVKFKLLEAPSGTDRRVIFYSSVSDAPGVALGYLEVTSYDADTKIDTYSTGSGVHVPAGEFWISFQCKTCSNYKWDDTTSTSKTGTLSHTLGVAGGSEFRRVDFGVTGKSGYDVPTVVYNYSLSPSFAISGTLSADTTAPTLDSSTPLDGATGVLPDANIVLNFNENVATGTGNISIVRTSDDVAQVIDVTSAAVTVSGSQVTVNPGTDLDLNTAYHVLIDATAIVDTADTPNAFAGISTNTVLNFTTIAPPELASSVPIDGATGVTNTANVVLNFDRNVTAQSGKNVTLVNTSDASDNRVIAANDAQITVAGSSVTINPTNDLKINSNYAVIFDAGAFEDANGIAVVALTDQTTLNFTTDKITHAGLTAALDASNSSSYPGTGSKWTDLSGNNNHIELKNSPTFDSNGPKSFTFNGTSQYGLFEDAGTAIPDLLNKSAYTKLIWFKPQGFDDNNNLMSSSGNNAHALWGGGRKAECTATGDNLASGHNGQWYEVQADTCLETEWQMMAVTFASSNSDENTGWRIYRNGDMVGSSNVVNEISEANNGYSTRIASYSTGYFFEGQIARVYVYDRTLSASEIDQTFEASAGEFGLNLNTVTFNPNGGEVDTPTLRTNVSDGTVTLRTPTKANATFLGWYTASTGGTKVGDAGDSYDPNGNDVTLFAQWDNTYTVTYSAGTNATGAPASVQFKDSTGPVTLPTPSRDDYEFNGWYTAATGGTKVANAGASFTATSDVTLHGQWTQLSLAGIDPADLTLVNSDTIISDGGSSTAASSTTRTVGNSSVTLNVPAGAFDPGVVVRLYSVANHDKAQAVLTNESDFVNSMVVAWSASDTTVPVANSDLTMVIIDANIKAGAKVYSILGNQSTLLATATQDGTVTIAFATDPLVTIANPAPAPAPQNNSGGGGGGAPAPGPTAATKLVPTLDEHQVIEIDENKEQTVLLTGANLDLINSVKHGDTELNFEVSESAEQITVVIPASLEGQMMLELFYGDDHLEQMVTVNEVSDPSVVNAGTFKGVVAIFAKNLEGKRLSAKVGEDWVIVDSLNSRFVRIIERVRWVGYDLAVRIFVDRKLIRTVNLVTQ